MKRYIYLLLLLISVVAVTICFATEGNAEGSSKRVAIVLELPEPINEFSLPDSVEIIEDEAFEGTIIIKVELPETVTTIGARAFANITTLRSIRIPVATTSIASTAFIGSNQLTVTAAPNSYARKFARAVGIPFIPFASFCAANRIIVNIISTKDLNKDVAIGSSDTHQPEKHWQKFEEIKVAGILDQVFYDIQSRGPPMGRC